MPAAAPPLDISLTTKLAALGERLRAHRKGLRISANDMAEAAGLSRVTLHRIERGEPSVTMGAYFSVIDALGWSLQAAAPAQARHPPEPAAGAAPALPARLRLADYPELQRLAWQLQGVDTVTPGQALSLYERNWRHLDTRALLPHERDLVTALAQQLAGGRLLV